MLAHNITLNFMECINRQYSVMIFVWCCYDFCLMLMMISVHILMSSVSGYIHVSIFPPVSIFLPVLISIFLPVSIAIFLPVCFEFSAMSIKLSDLILRVVCATKAPDLPKRSVTGLWYRGTWGVVLGTNVSGTRTRYRSGETGIKLVRTGTKSWLLWYTVSIRKRKKKTIRKEIKSGSFKARGGGGLHGTKMVKKSETIEGFCPQGDVCQSGLGLEGLVFQNCHGKHPSDVQERWFFPERKF